MTEVKPMLEDVISESIGIISLMVVAGTRHVILVIRKISQIIEVPNVAAMV